MIGCLDRSCGDKCRSWDMGGKFLRILQAMFEDISVTISLGDVKTGWVVSQVGLTQGCVLSPILFELYIHDLEKKLLQVDSGIQVGEAMVPGLFFTDDMVLVASNEVRLQRLLETTVRFGEQRKMELNGKKSKVMTNWRTVAGNKWRVGRKWVPDGEEYALMMEEADEYKYLGVRIQARGRRFDIH